MDISDRALSRAPLMSGDDFREPLRRLKPVVHIDGQLVESVVDEPALKPGVNALAYIYDFALNPQYAPIALAAQVSRNRGQPPAARQRLGCRNSG